jgi:long-chain acyl-CoA synthetase
VPRIYERIYNKVQDQLKTKPPIAQKLFQAAVDVGWKHFEYQQNRAKWSPSLLAHPLLNHLIGNKIQQKLGRRLRIAICGGAPLSETIAQTFIGLGVPIYQGYGLTETSPVVSVNTAEKNLPKSIGRPLQDVEVRFSDAGELLVRSPGVMQGYWKDEKATKATIDNDGWLHTGDLGRQDENGFILITGRLKEIIVLANGEKVPPADMEMAIAMDPYIEHILVIGEGKPYMTGLVVLSDNAWDELAEEAHLENHSRDKLQTNTIFLRTVLQHVRRRLLKFPSYAQIVKIALTRELWTVENGLTTPTLKPKRSKIIQRYQSEIDQLYRGH